MTYHLKIVSLIFLFGSIINSCSVFQGIDEALPDHRADYGKSESTTSLEVPPDLLAGDMGEGLAIPEASMQTTSKQNEILPVVTDMHIKREGDIRWLEVDKPVDVVWQKVQAFWQSEGFNLTYADPKTGVMETEWKENRANLPQDGLRKLVGKVLDGIYSSSTRDKFRTRLERVQIANNTAIYLTHRGAEEVSQRDTFVWQARPTDPELEAEILRRLMIFMGLEKQQAETVVAAERESVSRATLQHDKSNQMYLLVQVEFEQAWQRIGLALDRLGFAVEDRNRAQGVYHVQYLDPEQNIGEGKGFWASWFGDEEETDQQQYIISLLDAPQGTRVLVKNSAEQIDETSEHILTLLQTQLK